MGSNKKKNELLNPEAMPQHIAIIMDGNGRWAKGELTRSMGHREGSGY